MFKGLSNVIWTGRAAMSAETQPCRSKALIRSSIVILAPMTGSGAGGEGGRL